MRRRLLPSFFLLFFSFLPGLVGGRDWRIYFVEGFIRFWHFIFSSFLNVSMVFWSFNFGHLVLWSGTALHVFVSLRYRCEYSFFAMNVTKQIFNNPSHQWPGNR